jgi:quinol monooxygenase YgiN
MLGVTVYFDIKPGREADFESAATEMIDAVRAKEPGAVFYSLFKSQAEGTYVFMERWADQAALDAHMDGPPHVAAVAPKFMDCIDGDPDMSVYEVVA